MENTWRTHTQNTDNHRDKHSVFIPLQFNVSVFITAVVLCCTEENL